VPGLYIIGALAGYPLIKYGLKQGYEAVEHILGNHPAPADEPILAERLRNANLNTTVAQFIAALRQRVALFAPLPVRQIREFLLHARVRRAGAGELIYERHEYSDRLYWVLEGELALETGEPQGAPILCPVGDVLGALEFVSGRRRTGAATATRLTLLLEADRAAMAVLFRASPQLRQAIDQLAMARQIKLHLAPGLQDAAVAELVRTARIERFEAGAAIVQEGDADDPLQLVRRGSASVSRRAGERETMLAYLPAGSFIGESGWLAGRRPASVRATTATETIRLDGAAVRRVLDAAPAMRERIAAAVAAHLGDKPAGARGDGVVRFLLDHGIGEATDVLLIDAARCVGCDNCEKACAETHGGVSALDRQAGAQHGTLHLPNACRHCEHPHCMSDCPTNSLRRTPDGSVYIDDTCTGCGHCERNCPYGAIRMAGLPEKKPGLLARLLFGWGEVADEEAARPVSKHAVKCDGCRGKEAPACVSACPTGAAIRVNPESFIAAQLKAHA
jgi:Fe-S-cluster-containing dehydrogenase component/CRP-like cAMP-binding protein